MKLSVFHQTHGLSGHIRLGGQMLNFHFQKGEQEILVEVGVGGMTTYGKLRIAPRSTENPADALDMVLTLIVPDVIGIPDVIGAKKPVTVVAGPEGPKSVDSGNPETRSIASGSQGGALANRAVAQAMGEGTRVRVAPEPRPPYRDQNASLDRDMGRPNATQRLMNDDQAVPSYERVATIAEIVSHVDTDKGDSGNVRERELIHRVKRTDPEVMPEVEVEALDDAPIEESETYVSDPTAVPELPEMRGFNEGPPENPDPNWSGGRSGGKKNRRR